MRQERLGQEFRGFEVSTGTLNEFHLLETYHDFLADHYLGYSEAWESFATVRLIIINKMTKDGDMSDWVILSNDGHSQVIELVNETLPDMIEELAPKGCYFGSNEGSASDIGFWPLVDLPDRETDI